MGFKHTLNQRRGRVAAVTSVAMIAMIVVAVNMTGALFSDTHDGKIEGNLGSIRVTPSGGSGADSTNFTFNDMLPGESQTATLDYSNTGKNSQDVWVVFPNATALSALNDLGTYGEAHIKNGSTPVFDSANLNDHANSCGAFTPNQTSQGPGCWPLPRALKLASNVAPGQGGTMKFSFSYASKLKLQPPAGVAAPFNAYPSASQFTKNVADGTGAGLPYQLVATQVGQQP